MRRPELDAHVGLEEQCLVPERIAAARRDRRADTRQQLHQATRRRRRDRTRIPARLLTDQPCNEGRIEAVLRRLLHERVGVQHGIRHAVQRAGAVAVVDRRQRDAQAA